MVMMSSVLMRKMMTMVECFERLQAAAEAMMGMISPSIVVKAAVAAADVAAMSPLPLPVEHVVSLAEYYWIFRRFWPSWPAAPHP